MERKPEFAAEYKAVQELITKKMTLEERHVQIESMFDEAEDQYALKAERERKAQEGIWSTIVRWLWDKNHSVIKELKAHAKQGPMEKQAAQEAIWAMEETNYIQAEASEYLRNLGLGVMDVMKETGITPAEFGKYLFLFNVSQDRKYLFNPKGITESEANLLLSDLRGEWGDTKFATVEKMAADFRALRETTVIEIMRESGLVGKDSELMKAIEQRKGYVRMEVLDYINKEFGTGAGSQLYTQVGTLKGVANPLVATVLQDLSLIRAVRINMAKTKMMDVLAVDGLAITADTETGRDGEQKPKMPEGLKADEKKWVPMTIFRNGKKEHYYVPELVGKTWDASPAVAMQLGETWATANSMIRQLLVSKNPMWMARNIFRDFRTTFKNIPEIKIRHIPKLMGYYARAWKSAWQEGMNANRDEIVQWMANNRAMVVDRAWNAKEVTAETELERIANEFRLDFKAANDSKEGQSMLKTMWNTLDKLGRTTELWGKIAGAQYLKDNTLRSDKEIASIVRTRIATPDFMRRGDLQNITNNLFLFSNVGKEGIRAAIESYQDDHASYVWKTFASNVAPKLILLGAAVGLFGDDLKKIIERIPEYDKSNFTVIPLGLTDTGKAVYLRIPEDYEGQFFGAAFWKTMTANVGGRDGLLKVASEQAPWGLHKLHPYIQTARDLGAYYIMGLNPIDSWRGREILSRKAYAAGGVEAAKEMMAHGWRSMGGSVLYNPPYTQLVKSEETWQKISKWPGLNVPGTFLKMSDRGVTDVSMKIRDAKKSFRAKVNIEIEDRITALVNEKGEPRRSDVIRLRRELVREGLLDKDTSMSAFSRRYRRMASKRHNNPMVNSYLYASSNAEKEEMLKYFKLTLYPSEYRDGLRILRREGHITSRTKVKVPK
jgi:hypothetical protein